MSTFFSHCHSFLTEFVFKFFVEYLKSRRALLRLVILMNYLLMYETIELCCSYCLFRRGYHFK